MKFVVMKSGFGDFWIGKTDLELPKQAKAFDNFEDAQEVAMELCVTCENRDELEFMEEDEIETEDEIIDKKMLKWLA